MLYIIAGQFKNRKLRSPSSQSTRPTTSKLRETLFNICQNYVVGASFLDVFAGSGAMGIEALSRGAKKATFIDNDRHSIQCIRENLKTLDIEQAGELLLGDALSVLKKLNLKEEKFDIIYMDPPYEVEGLIEKLIQVIDESSLLQPDGVLFIEESKAVLIDNDKWHTLCLKSRRKMGRSQLLQINKLVSS